jgi:CRISPR-associated protein Cas1
LRRANGAQELGRFQDRLSFLYVESCRVDRDNNAVTVIDEKGAIHVPTAILAALLLGPGTRITQAAVTLLADCGTSVLWVGQEGVRLYAAGLGTARSTRLLVRQAKLVSNQRSRLRVARTMYEMRFPGESVSRLTMQQLRGREGARVRDCYRSHSERTGVTWRGRSYDRSRWMASDPVNRALSSANACLYGVAHAAITHLGCSPGLGFIHTGHALSLVYDIADLYKAEVTIPVAFDVAATGGNLERSARVAVRDRAVEAKLLPRMVADIRCLFGFVPEEDVLGEDQPDDMQLWDPESPVPSGLNHAS